VIAGLTLEYNSGAVEGTAIPESAASGVVGRGKWLTLIELFAAVLDLHCGPAVQIAAVMRPTVCMAPHVCSETEPFSANEVRQIIVIGSPDRSVGVVGGR